MRAVTRWWASFDADDAFSFTTPREVRIKDRRLGLTYYAFLVAILGYIVGFVIIKNGGYLARVPAEGATRLQLLAPPARLRTSLDDLVYCNQTGPGGQGLYQTDSMAHAFCTFPCRSENEILAVYPPVEIDAMFITTRINTTDVLQPPDCDPIFNTSCDFTYGNHSTFYLANIEFFTLKVDHSLDIPAFSVFVPVQRLKFLGLRDKDDNIVDVCTVYLASGRPCPNLPPNVFPIASLLQAAGVPGSTLDSTLNLTEGGSNETRRYAGMVLLLDIAYGGSLSLSGSAEDLTFVLRPRFATGQEYKIQEESLDGDPNNDVAYTLVDRHGIRIIVNQVGSIGRFDFQTLLLTLTSALALLAGARIVISFLAFQVLPLKHLYRQYKGIDTIRFRDLTPDDLDRFRRQDLINPRVDVGRGDSQALITEMPRKHGYGALADEV